MICVLPLERQGLKLAYSLRIIDTISLSNADQRWKLSNNESRDFNFCQTNASTEVIKVDLLKIISQMWKTM